MRYKDRDIVTPSKVWNNTSISSHAAQCLLLFLVGQLGARMVHELGIQDFVSYEIAVG